MQPEQFGQADTDQVLIEVQNKSAFFRDGYEHAAWVSRKGGLVWIVRAGGFAGVMEWYGPVAMPDPDIAGCTTIPVPTIKPAATERRS